MIGHRWCSHHWRSWSRSLNHWRGLCSWRHHLSDWLACCSCWRRHLIRHRRMWHPSSAHRRWGVEQWLLTCRSALVYYGSLWDRRSNISRRRRSHLLRLRLLHLIRWSDSSGTNFFLLFSLLCRIKNLGSVWRRLVESLAS